MSSNECNAPTSDSAVPIWILDGGFLIIVYSLLSFFYGLAFVCDHYFVPALDILCDDLKIPPNVAGATFMAVGTSAPDVFISLFGLFFTRSTLGMGTIVGSAIFNHLCICAACIIYSKTGSITLDPKILTREVIAYFGSLLLMMYALRGALWGHDAFERSHWQRCLIIEWSDGLVLMFGYAVYALVVANFNRICTYICGSPPRAEKNITTDSTKNDEENVIVKDSGTIELAVSVTNTASVDVSEVDVSEEQKRETLSPSLVGQINPMHAKETPSTVAVKSTEDTGITTEECKTRYTDAVEKLMSFWEVFNLPLRYLITATIPDVSLPETSSKYGIAIFASIVWLGILSEVVVECIQVLGTMMDVSLGLMGLTVSAVGASLPSIWSSMIVAREGKGDMAVSNAMGSNTFSILGGLGFPWFAYTLYTGDYRGIKDGGIILLLLMLCLILFLFYVMIYFNNWTLKMWMAPIFLLTYVIVIVLSILYFSGDN